MVGVLRDQRELIAAEARKEGVAGRCEQPARHLAQQLISGGMPEDVVHLFQAVEIDADDGKALP